MRNMWKLPQMQITQPKQNLTSFLFSLFLFRLKTKLLQKLFQCFILRSVRNKLREIHQLNESDKFKIHEAMINSALGFYLLVLKLHD